MRALVNVAVLAACASRPVARPDWHVRAVKRVSAVTAINKVPFTIELLESMVSDDSRRDRVLFGPATDRPEDGPTIFILDVVTPQTIEEYAASLPRDGSKITMRETVSNGWWVAIAQPSHAAFGADGKTSYSFRIHAQLGALTCDGYVDGYEEQLRRVAKLCTSVTVIP